MQTAEAADDAPVAGAVIGAAGRLERATSLFRERCGDYGAFLVSHRSQIDLVLEGAATQTLDGGSAHLAAVMGADGARCAFLTLAAPDGANVFYDAVDTSPAIVWLKDLDGRYRRVNARYEAQLGMEAERVCGKTEAELALGESIEGLRPHREGEPLELEYVIAASGERPAFSVLRFALRGADGEPFAVCGVAAPAAQAAVAEAECARLMRLERWLRADESEASSELLQAWGLIPLGGPAPQPPQRPRADDARPPADDERLAALTAELETTRATSERLSRELAEERQRLADEREHTAKLEKALSRVEGDNAATADAIAEEQRTVRALRDELEQAQRQTEQTRAALAEARARAEQSHAEKQSAVTQVHAELRRLRAEAGECSAALEAERRAVEVIRAELERTQAALASRPSEQELEDQRSRAERAESAGEQARREADETSAALKTTQAEAESLRRESTALREQLERVHHNLGAKHSQELTQALGELRRARADAVEAATDLATQKAITHTLTAELSAVRQELSEARRGAHESPEPLASVDLEQERRRAEEAERALEVQRRLAEEALEVQRRLAEEALAAAEADRRSLEAMHAELEALRTELEDLRASGLAAPLSAEADAPGPTAPDEVTDEGPGWSAVSQLALSAALMGVSDWHTALGQTAKAVGLNGGWDVAVAWHPERDGAMKCAAMWAKDAGSMGKFETRTWQHRPKLSAISSSGTADGQATTWVLDLAGAQDALLRAAAAEGMRSAVLVEISNGSGPAAILGLLSRSAAGPTAGLELSLQAIALQLGALAQQLHAGQSPRWHVGRM